MIPLQGIVTQPRHFQRLVGGPTHTLTSFCRLIMICVTLLWTSQTVNSFTNTDYLWQRDIAWKFYHVGFCHIFQCQIWGKKYCMDLWISDSTLCCNQRLPCFLPKQGDASPLSHMSSQDALCLPTGAVECMQAWGLVFAKVHHCHSTILASSLCTVTGPDQDAALNCNVLQIQKALVNDEVVKAQEGTLHWNGLSQLADDCYFGCWHRIQNSQWPESGLSVSAGDFYGGWITGQPHC